MSSDELQRVELQSVEVLPNGESFVLGLVASNREVQHLALPSWTVHQLMRLLPRLDAALLRAQHQATSEVIAYRAVQWNIERSSGADRGIALRVRSDRQVESAFSFEWADAVALHAALGDVLAAGVSARAGRAGV